MAVTDVPLFKNNPIFDFGQKREKKKKTPTIVFVRMVKKLINLTKVLKTETILLSIIKKSCSTSANTARINPIIIAVFLKYLFSIKI